MICTFLKRLPASSVMVLGVLMYTTSCAPAAFAFFVILASNAITLRLAASESSPYMKMSTSDSVHLTYIRMYVYMHMYVCKVHTYVRVFVCTCKYRLHELFDCLLLGIKKGHGIARVPVTVYEVKERRPRRRVIVVDQELPVDFQGQQRGEHGAAGNEHVLPQGGLEFAQQSVAKGLERRLKAHSIDYRPLVNLRTCVIIFIHFCTRISSTALLKKS